MTCSKGHENFVSSLFCAACGERLEKKPEANEDYITLIACINPQRALVCWMAFDKPSDSYTMKKCSEPLSQKGAQALADSWAAALKLEVR